MVKDISLHILVSNPLGIVDKGINLKRQSPVIGRKLPDHPYKSLVNSGMVLQIILNILSESTYVG